MRSTLVLLMALLVAPGCHSSKPKRRPVPPPVDYSAAIGTWDATCVSGPVGSVESFTVSSTGRLTGWSAWGPFDHQLQALGSDRFRCVNEEAVELTLYCDGTMAATLTSSGGSSEWSLMLSSLIGPG